MLKGAEEKRDEMLRDAVERDEGDEILREVEEREKREMRC